MKNRYKVLPALFLIFGILLIAIISGLSISKYIKDNNKEVFNGSKNQTNAIENENKKEQDLQCFFDRPKTRPIKTLIKVYKKNRILELYGDGKIIGRFKIALGRSPEGEKEKEGDNKTPEGIYYICYRTEQTKYTYFMGLSYPNEKDAQRGLEKGIINKDAYYSIKKSIERKEQPPWNTPLGGEIGIHGGSNKYDWTYGCIALSNEDMNIIKQYALIKTQVEIYK